MTMQKAVLFSVFTLGLAFVLACSGDGGTGDSGPDANTEPDAGCTGTVVCDPPDAGGAAAMWSCYATSFDNPTCTDFPQATWSRDDAEAACAAAAEMGSGVITEIKDDSNCAVDQFPATWRCDATATMDGPVPAYYVYAETLPIGICVSSLTGTIVDLPADGCWKDYD